MNIYQKKKDTAVSEVPVTVEEAADNAIESTNKATVMKKTLKIEGMMCANCEKHVCKALSALPGVVSASANHEDGTAVVELNGEVSEADFRKAVEEEAGYRLTEIK